MRVISTAEFRKNKRSHLEAMFKGEEDAVFVADETSIKDNKSIVILSVPFAIEVFSKAGFLEISHAVDRAREVVLERISQRLSNTRRARK